MSEHPIICNSETVRAILDGRKTQTRRPMKMQPHDDLGDITVGTYHPTKIDRHGEEYPGEPIFGAYSSCGEWGLKCPYGKPGDVLWVRETWCEGEYFSEEGEIWYRANSADAECFEQKKVDGDKMKWRPSIHMPKWACRLRLLVKRVWAERVKDISVEDATAEGVQIPGNNKGGIYLRISGKYPPHDYYPKGTIEKGVIQNPDAVFLAHFASLWDSLYGDGAWDRNDMVWAREFEVQQ